MGRSRQREAQRTAQEAGNLRRHKSRDSEQDPGKRRRLQRCPSADAVPDRAEGRNLQLGCRFGAEDDVGLREDYQSDRAAGDVRV